MVKLEFNLKVDTSEMTKAVKELGIALQNLQKATIHFSDTVKPKPWYIRLWNWCKNLFV